MQEESTMVLESARRHLATLGPLAEQLNDASDAFTEELKTVEAELGKLNLGLAVTLDTPLIYGDLEEEVDEQRDEVTGRYRMNSYLAFMRHRQEWKLLVRTFCDYEDYSEQVTRSVMKHETPLLTASRELRMAAAEQIEKLLKVIAREAKDKLESLNKVIDKK